MFIPGIIVIAYFLILSISGSLASKSRKECLDKLRNRFFAETSLKGEDSSSDTCKCGTTLYKEEHELIISGTKVKDASKYPFVVQIDANNETSGWSGCGGAIISPTFILTAGHCIVNESPHCFAKLSRDCFLTPNDIKIGVFNEVPTRLPSKYVKIKKIIPLPDMSITDSANDIALIELQRPLKCTNYARPICISKKQVVRVGDNIQVSGYGRMYTDSRKTSNILREGNMKVVESKYCKQGNNQRLLCVVGENQSVCNGDSGTAAFVKKRGIYIAVGITSAHTSPICELGKPSRLMRIKNHYSFIKEHVRDLPEL